MDDIESDQLRLKNNIILLENLTKEMDKKESELRLINEDIKNKKKELIILYNNIDFGEKEQIKKYLQLKMNLDELVDKKRKIQSEKKHKRVTIQDFKVSSIDIPKIEYLNIPKTILSVNRIKIEPQKINSESKKSFKKTLKKNMSGGSICQSILKKKGSMKNTKNISWDNQLEDGTPIIDNSFSDLSDLEHTTDIDLSSISGDLIDNGEDLDLSNLNIVDNNQENIYQEGGNLSSNFVNVNDNHGNLFEPQISQKKNEYDIINLDFNNQDTIDRDSKNLRNTGFIEDNSDLINLDNKINIATNKDTQILQTSSLLIGGNQNNPEFEELPKDNNESNNLDKISVDNNISLENEETPNNTNIDSMKIDDSLENEETPNNISIDTGKIEVSLDNRNVLSEDEQTHDNKNIDMDKIEISFDDNNNLNIVSDDEDLKTDGILNNNSDIKIINLK